MEGFRHLMAKQVRLNFLLYPFPTQRQSYIPGYLRSWHYKLLAQCLTQRLEALWQSPSEAFVSTDHPYMSPLDG